MTNIEDIKDPNLRLKLEAVLAEHSKQQRQELPAAVHEYPRYVFTRGSRASRGRSIGDAVRVRNGLDEEARGGTITDRRGPAFLVDLGDMTILVHEPDDSWVPFEAEQDDPLIG